MIKSPLPVPWILPAAALALLAGCSETPQRASPQPLTQAEIDRGLTLSAALADRYAQQLQAELSAAMAAGGTSGGIAVCASRAPEIAQSLSAESGASIRRTAFRTRNPAAVPAADERRLMEPWQQTPLGADSKPATGHLVTRVAGREDALLFMRAIPLADGCTACHGAAGQISDETRAALAQFYPKDQATGFAPGDFRGAFSIRWSAAQLRAMAQQAQPPSVG